MAGPKGKPLLDVINSLTQAVFGVVNIVMKAAPIGAFGAMAFTIGKYGIGALAQLALLVATFWPLLFYIPTGMTEPLQFGIAFLCAALLESPKPSRVNTAARVALVVVGTWLRPTWAFVIPTACRWLPLHPAHLPASTA